MTIELVTIPCLSDNYAFLIHDKSSSETMLVDAPEAKPITQKLQEKGWRLTHVFLTHHHSDHVDGLSDVIKNHDAKIIGSKTDKKRLPALDIEVSEGDQILVGNQRGQIFDVSGHTLGHLAVSFKEAKVVFTGDSLMALGCGRVFEGNHSQMWGSLKKMRALDPEYLVCSGHEYTASNARFALTIDPDNLDLQKRAKEIGKMRSQNLPTVPSKLELEIKTNPFLRPQSAEIRNNLNMNDCTDEEVFSEIRDRKDKF